MTAGLQRIRQGTLATLSLPWTDNDDSAADAGGAVTVGITKADGTVVVAAGTATLHPAVGTYTKDVTAAQTAALNILTATYTDASSSTTRTRSFEIVGGRYFSFDDVRSTDDALRDPVKYSDALLAEIRDECEQELEEITAKAFVPKFVRLVLDGSGNSEINLITADGSTINRPRRIVSARMYTTPGAATFVTLTTQQLADLALTNDGVVVRADGNVWNDGRSNIVLEVEYGEDQPFADLKKAILIRARDRLVRPKYSGGIPDRAKVWTNSDGTSYELDAAGRRKTGLADVDAVYDRYSANSGDAGKARPYSRALDFDPQRYSMFHGPQR